MTRIYFITAKQEFKRLLFKKVATTIFLDNNEEEQISVLKGLLTRVEGKSILIADYIPYKDRENNIFELLLNSLLKENLFRLKIDAIILFIADHQLAPVVNFLRELDNYRDLFPGIQIISKLNTVIFNRRALLLDKYNESDPLELEAYSRYISDFIAELFESGMKSNSISPNNIAHEKWLFLSNCLLPNFKIGSVSYIAPAALGDSYALDLPFKKYFIQLNEILLNNGYTNFLTADNLGRKEFSWIHFSIELVAEKKILCYYRISTDSNPNHPFNNYSNNSKEVEFWIISLFIGIYYFPSISFNGNEYADWSVDIVHSKNLLSPKKYIDIFWFHYVQHYSFLHSKGYVNFTLYTDKCKEIQDESHLANLLYRTNHSLIDSKILETVVPFYINEWRAEAIRSAIAKVMARNSSHNIGSHVLSRLVEPSDITLERITSDFKTDYRSCFLPKQIFPYKKNEVIQEDLDQDKTEEELISITKRDFYDILLSYFFSYLKTRMDLLADIVTSTPNSQISKLFVKEVLAGIDKNRILLNRISGIDNFKYRFDFRLPVGKDDILVSIYNDVMGQHSLYIILENIIRNTAKHGIAAKQSREAEDVVFLIQVEECQHNASYYSVTISDNIPIHGHYTYIDREQIPHELSTKIDWTRRQVRKIDKLQFEQNKRINLKILDPKTNALRQGALGLIEMEVCSAYLRGIPIEMIEDDAYDIKFLQEEIEAQKDKIKKGEADLRLLRAVQVNDCLGYRFYLPKPKEVLLIDQVGDIWDACYDSEAPDPYHHLKYLQGEGILVQRHDTAPLKTTPLYWQYQPDINYPQAIVVINASQDWWPNRFQSRRFVQWNEVQELFALFQEHNQLSSSLKHILSLDLLAAPRKWINEVWRAFIYKRLVEKRLRIVNGQIYTRFFYQEENPNFTPYKISFYDHGKNYQGNSAKDYLEIFGSKSKDLTDQISDFRSPYNLSKMKFMDAAVTNVLVLDERIQEQAETNYALEGNEVVRSLTYREIWDNVNVYIPNREELDLNKQNFSQSYIEAIRLIIREQFGEKAQRPCKGLDFLVVHLGILEKILMTLEYARKDDPRDILNLLNSFVSELSSPPRFIISSGRAPTEIPGEISYISYSILSQYIIENRFKYTFNEMLHAARPKGKS